MSVFIDTENYFFYYYFNLLFIFYDSTKRKLTNYIVLIINKKFIMYLNCYFGFLLKKGKCMVITKQN